MDRPIVDGRWRVHINGEGGMMVSVDMIAMVTSEGYERSELWLRAKRVMGWSCSVTLLWRKFLECSSSHCSLRHPCDLTLMEEGSGVFFLTLLTSSSLCPHSLRYPCVLTPMTCLLTHLIVIPDFSLESSHPSHLTLSLPSLVLPCSLIPACSHITPTTTHSHECSHTECSHTHRHP